MVLPIIVKALLNNALLKMEGYKGRIDQLRIHLVNGQISFNNISIRSDSVPQYDELFLHVPAITIDFKWKQLLKKIVDLNIVVDKPKILFVAEALPSPGDNSSNTTQEISGLKDRIEKKMAFKINAEVRSGEIHYVNSNVNPKLDITTSKLNVKIHDFANRTFLSNSCHILGSCDIYGGNAKFNATLLPLEPTLTVDLNLELKSINLVLLNEYLRAYGKVDVSSGTLDLYTEIALADNSFKGYVKPLLKDLDFISAEDRGDNMFRKIWERIVAGFYNVLENSRNAQVATKIPFEGRLDDPHVRVGAAVLNILKNAFVKALTPSLDDIINLRSIWKIVRSL